LNGFDIAVVVITVCFVVLGLLKGFVRLLIGLASLVVAFLLASRFEPVVAERLMALRMSQGPARFVAYLAIFVATMVVGGVVAWLLRKILSATFLGWADRLAGGAVGFVAAALASAFVLYPVVAYSNAGDRLLAHSKLAPYVAVVADVVNKGAPKDLAERYKKEMESLRRLWRDPRLHRTIVTLPSARALS
jgi:membrane protein required for colicin V production